MSSVSPNWNSDPLRCCAFSTRGIGRRKQRVVIATAFACNPELIIFDEPTTALDIYGKADFELSISYRAKH